MAFWPRRSAPARALVELIADGNVEALAGLTGAADKLGYFTGAGTMGVTALTALARTLIGKSTAADMRSAIGMGTGDAVPLKTLSLSGVASVAGKEIVAAGSNGNGRYTSFYDGTQICRRSYVSGVDVNWAAAFASTPDVVATCGVDGFARFATVKTVSATTVSVQTFSDVGGTSGNFGSVIGIGLWS